MTQAERDDPGHVPTLPAPELADAQGPSVHEPWRLRGLDRPAAGDHPDPIVDLSDGLTRFERARGPAEA